MTPTPNPTIHGPWSAPQNGIFLRNSPYKCISRLKNTISRLTDRRFSDVGEKLDIAAPNTNKHAIEGSNPIFTSDVAKAPKDNNDFEIGDFDRKR